MLEFIGFCAILFLLFKFGGDIIKGAFTVLFGLILFFLALPFLIVFLSWIYNLFPSVIIL